MAWAEPQRWCGEKQSAETAGGEATTALDSYQSNLEQQHVATLLSHGLTSFPMKVFLECSANIALNKTISVKVEAWAIAAAFRGLILLWARLEINGLSLTWSSVHCCFSLAQFVLDLPNRKQKEQESRGCNLQCWGEPPCLAELRVCVLEIHFNPFCGRPSIPFCPCAFPFPISNPLWIQHGLDVFTHLNVPFRSVHSHVQTS